MVYIDKPIKMDYTNTSYITLDTMKASFGPYTLLQRKIKKDQGFGILDIRYLLTVPLKSELSTSDYCLHHDFIITKNGHV